MIMNRFICFDNLRSAAVVLTLAALLLQSWTAFYEESAVVAISIVFFISAYFGASALRIRTISFFLKDKWKRLGWPGLVLVLFGIDVSLEADVFEMTRMITAKNATGACKKLQALLRLQQEPIAITAALIGSYVDLYRVKLGSTRRKSYSTVFKEFGYKGSDYRLKRSAETASHYTLGQLEACLQVLLDLDRSLKSQPVDAEVLLEAALCRLALAGSGR